VERVSSDDASESAYFLMRAALAKSVSEAAGYITQRGLVEEGAPAIVRLITQLAMRFGVNVSEKVAAQAVPVIGAAGGVAIAVVIDQSGVDAATAQSSVVRGFRIS
jgi:EcsC protein family